jgi:CRP/FNR family transcriptional regulator, cyclic AMP receptor protein
VVVQNKGEAIKSIHLFRGLDQAELTQVANLCTERSYGVGELCQTEGQSENRVHLILRGRVGSVLRIPNITYCSGEIILDTLHADDVFGWSSLIKDKPWSTLRVIEPLEVLYVNTDDLLKLCENNSHIGYVLMRNLASLVASRLRRNRVSILNAIVAIKGV